MPLPYIPEEITVHLGPPGSDAQNVTLSFRKMQSGLTFMHRFPLHSTGSIQSGIVRKDMIMTLRIRLLMTNTLYREGIFSITFRK